MLKRILVLSMMIISMPSFATDVTGGETCDTNVLNTDTGPVNLRAEFEPETIDLRWYNSNTLLDTTSTNSNTCTYDTAINLPANPTKPGYKFKGWKIRPEYDFATFDVTINGNHRYGRGVDTTNNIDRCYYEGNLITCNTDFTDLNRYEWKALFSYGTVYGESMCSSVSGIYRKPGNPINDGGQYCWCRATGFRDNEDVIYSPTASLSWIFSIDWESASVCTDSCAARCAVRTQLGQIDRVAIYGQHIN